MKVGADLESDDRRAGSDPAGARARRRPDDGRQPGLGRRRGDRVDAARSRAHDPWWIEEPTSPDDVLGHARIRRRDRADPRRDGRARAEPRDLQAALPGRGDRRLPDRRVPHRRRQRGDRGAAAGGEVRHPRVPARRRRRPLRVRAAPRVLRLHRRQRLARRTGSSSGSTTCTSTSAIRRSSRDGRYVAPPAPGYSIEMLPASLDEYEFPNGPAWAPVEGAVGGG